MGKIRKSEPSKQVRIKCKLMEDISKLPGKTVSEKIGFLYRQYDNKRVKEVKSGTSKE